VRSASSGARAMLTNACPTDTGTRQGNAASTYLADSPPVRDRGRSRGWIGRLHAGPLSDTFSGLVTQAALCVCVEPGFGHRTHARPARLIFRASPEQGNIGCDHAAEVPAPRAFGALTVRKPEIEPVSEFA
jgi:hypothetical protein